MRIPCALLAILLGLWLIGCGAEDDSSSDADAAAQTDDDAQSGDDDDNDDNDDDNDNDSGPSPDELLARFRPLIVQGLADDYASLPYPETSDELGLLSVHEGDGDFEYTVQVDVAQPIVYEYWSEMTIRGEPHLQLLYAFFYPERPLPITFFDNPIEFINMFIWSGLIDGKVVRVTLDAARETALFIEVARNCGCDWQFYVNKLVDDAARAEYEAAGEEYPGLVKRDAPHDVTYVHILPADKQSATDAVVVAAEPGWTGDYPHHLLGAFTSFEQWRASDTTVAPGDLYLPPDANAADFAVDGLTPVSYASQRYDALYTLPLAGTDQEIGIFDAFHYVWNSYSPLTNWMRHQCCFTKYPGTPKDPAFLEVVHETIDFWDPVLYETFIYLPESLFGPAE
jgi:hypothetical protein